MTDEQQTKKFLISGRVQGVGFRWFTKRAAEKAGITGSVKNLSDGRVEAVAHGSSDALDSFKSDLKQGPPASRVDTVDEQTAQKPGGESFEITG